LYQYFKGNEFQLEVNSDSQGGLITGLIRSYSFAWFSIDAGVKYFNLNTQFYIPRDFLYSFFDFLPSQLMKSLGMQSLSITDLPDTDRLACVNTEFFEGMKPCTIPPGAPGYSAYFFPLAGALIFGFIKFFIYTYLLKKWNAV